jgi:hypothetical protein
LYGAALGEHSFHGVRESRARPSTRLSRPRASPRRETPHRDRVVRFFTYKKVRNLSLVEAAACFLNEKEHTRDRDSLCGFFVLPLGASTMPSRLRFHRNGGAPTQTRQRPNPVRGSTSQHTSAQSTRQRERTTEAAVEASWDARKNGGEPHSIPGPDSLKGEKEWALSEYSYSLLPSGLTRIATGWLVRLLRLRTKLWPRENCCCASKSCTVSTWPRRGGCHHNEGTNYSNLKPRVLSSIENRCTSRSDTEVPLFLCRLSARSTNISSRKFH